MARSQRTWMAVLALVALQTTGCGKFSGLADQLGLSLAEANVSGQLPPRMGPRQPGPRPDGMFFLGADLQLTDDQKAQIKTIMEKYRPQPPADGQKPQEPKLVHDLLTAETVDATALRSALQAEQATRAAHKPPSRADMLAEVRAVLTSDQIATLATKLSERPEPKFDGPRPDKGDRFAKFEDKLNLTDAQKAALEAFQAKLKAGFEARKPADHHQAMVTFWQTGDKSVLTALEPAPPQFPLDEMVALAQLLDQNQRKVIFGHRGPGFGGPHGGHRGGPGFGPGFAHGGPGFPSPPAPRV